MQRLGFWLYGPLLPLLFVQGRLVRARIPLLPEASGPRHGRVVGGNGRISLAVLGESTAVGVGAAAQDEALAFRLAHRLARELSVSVEVQAVGRSGATVHDVRRELLAGLRVPVDAVLVVLGVNDAIGLTRGVRWTAALHGLVDDLRARGVQRVLFTGVPPLGELPALPAPMRSALGARAAYLDSLLARVCDERGAHHLRVRFPFRPDLVAMDGFHPSAAGYAAWADALVAAWPR